MGIKCIVLDADGVVINFEYFTSKLEKEYNLSHEKVQPFFKERFGDCLIGKRDLKEELLPYLKKWNWEKSVDEFLDFWFRAEDNPNLEMISYINSNLRKRFITILATNQEKYRTKFMIENMGFGKIFDMIISSADAGSKKPNKEFLSFIYENLRQKYSLKKEEIVFWDDNEANVVSAREFGFLSFKFNGLKEFNEVMNTLIKSP